METLSLLESAYPTLATSKSQMRGVLKAWRDLGAEQKANPEYIQEMDLALRILEKSASVPAMLAKLRSLNSNKE